MLAMRFNLSFARWRRPVERELRVAPDEGVPSSGVVVTRHLVPGSEVSPAGLSMQRR